MPVETWIIEHGKPARGNFIPEHKNQADWEKNHANDNMETMQAGDDIIKTKKNVHPRFSGNKSLRVRVNVMVELCTPFKVFIDEENNTTKNWKDKKTDRLFFGTSLDSSDWGGNCKTGYQQNKGIYGPNNSIQLLSPSAKNSGYLYKYAA